MLSAMYAQVYRMLSLPGAYAVISLAVVVAGVLRAFTGSEYGVGNSAAVSTITPTTGLVLAVYVLAGLGALVSAVGFKTSEDVYLFLSTGSLKKFIAAQVGTSFLLVLVASIPILGIYVTIAALKPAGDESLIPISMGLVVSAVTFFWFGHSLTSAFGNSLASLAIILLAPLILTPQLERLNPRMSALLPWSAVHEILYTGVAPQFVISCLAWIVFFVAVHAFIQSRWLR